MNTTFTADATGTGVAILSDRTQMTFYDLRPGATYRLSCYFQITQYYGKPYGPTPPRITTKEPEER